MAHAVVTRSIPELGSLEVVGVGGSVTYRSGGT